MLLAAHLSPAPTIVPVFNPEDAVALTSPMIDDWTDGQVDEDFPFFDDESSAR